ncbi:MAG: hypothetical protein HC945_02655 [Nitrosarchaeum sp.]|nr:hypothetical protein [Nitrosarchaeum sp.]
MDEYKNFLDHKRELNANLNLIELIFNEDISNTSFKSSLEALKSLSNTIAVIEGIAYLHLQNAHNMSLSRLTRAMNKSNNYVSPRLNISFMPITMQNQIRQGNLNISTANYIFMFFPPDQHETLTTIAIENEFTIRDLQRIFKQTYEVNDEENQTKIF